MDIGKRVLENFRETVDKHEDVDAKTFNDDKEYRLLTEELLNRKSRAEQKLQLFWGFVQQKLDPETLQRFYAVSLDKLDDSEVLKLLTGENDVDWQALISKPDVDLRQWRPAGLSAVTVETVRRHLQANGNIRSVTIAGEKIELKEGWSTNNLNMSEKKQLKNVWETCLFILACCTGRISLNLRFAQSENLEKSN